jgi:outer membrane protein
MHTISSRRSVALRLLPLVAACLLALPAHADDLVQVFRQAQTNDPQFASAKAAQMAGQERQEQGRAGVLPTLGATANLTGNYADVYSANPLAVPQVNYSWLSGGATLNLSVPLYRPANWEAYEQSKLQTSLADIVFNQAQQDLVTRVAQAYFDVLAAQDSVAFVKAKKVAIAEQLAQAKRNFEVGTATITDTHEAQARYDLAIAEELAAENDLRTKGTALQQIIGKMPATLAPLGTEVKLPSPTPASIDDWVLAAGNANYAVQQASIAAEIAKREIDRQRAGHLPTLDLVGSTGVTAQNRATSSNFRSRTTSAALGVQLSIPIYQGGAVDSRVREALANNDKSKADLETAKRAAEQGTRQAFLGVSSGLAQVRAFEAALVSSQSAVESNKLGYEVGVRINIDVLNAQQQLFQTRRDLAKARYDTILNSLRLKAAAGALKEEDLNAINALLVK